MPFECVVFIFPSTTSFIPIDVIAKGRKYDNLFDIFFPRKHLLPTQRKGISSKVFKMFVQKNVHTGGIHYHDKWDTVSYMERVNIETMHIIQNYTDPVASL